MPVGHRANGRLSPWATGTMREAGRHRGHPYQAKTRVPVDWSPAILMSGGPYAISRHPMYVGELALWLGWAILYGSIPVLIGFAVLDAVVARLAPREERALESKFGDVYRQYKARVPRWLGRSPGSGAN